MWGSKGAKVFAKEYASELSTDGKEKLNYLFSNTTNGLDSYAGSSTVTTSFKDVYWLSDDVHALGDALQLIDNYKIKINESGEYRIVLNLSVTLSSSASNGEKHIKAMLCNEALETLALSFTHLSKEESSAVNFSILNIETIISLTKNDVIYFRLLSQTNGNCELVTNENSDFNHAGGFYVEKMD